MVNNTAEIGLSSKGRLRIIRELELADHPLSIYMLEKRTGIRRRALRSDIMALASINWIEEMPGQVIKYELNRESEELKIIIKALYGINYINTIK